LVLACRLEQTEIVLTDRRERRTDLLRRACIRLGLDDRVTVLTGDVARLCLRADLTQSFSVVTARSFGPPLWTLTCSAPYLVPTGVVVVSEPPEDLGELRWPPEEVLALGFKPSTEAFAHVRRFDRFT
jgi:16S rRNA G527 N7-methylase RsmG